MKSLLSTAAFLLCTQVFFAQISLPPSGNNQKSIVTQYIGPIAHVTITYNSPDVTGSNGEDRTGKIWGQLVPYGLNNLGFGTSKSAPWRAGANENTIFECSHDILVEGKPLKAGKYGFFVIVKENAPWTLIFSKDNGAWGSYFYDEANDALRVDVKPEESEFHEWLTFEFIDRQPESATAALFWEKIKLPFTIEVENANEVILNQIRKELTGEDGFLWQNWNSAAAYCLQEGINLEEALTWAEKAISDPFSGAENFTTLSTKSRILNRMGRVTEAKAVMDKAIDHPSVGIFEVHGYGRQLIAQGEHEEALKIFQHNMDRFGDVWPVRVGLARAYSALGKYEEALKHAKIALERAPDDLNRKSMENAIMQLEKGKDIN